MPPIRHRQAARRKRIQEAFGGETKEISERKLPTWRNVVLGLENKTEVEEWGEKEAVKAVSEKIKKVYNLASIPTISNQQIDAKVKRAVQLKKERFIELRKDKRSGEKRVQGKFKQGHGKTRGRGTKQGKGKERLVELLDKLFDVAKDVPEQEKEFYEDQKTVRKMVIGRLDIEFNREENRRIAVENEKEAKKLERESAKKKRIENELQRRDIEMGAEKRYLEDTPGNSVEPKQKRPKRVEGKEQRKTFEEKETDSEDEHDQGGSKRRLKLLDTDSEEDTYLEKKPRKRMKKAESGSLKDYLCSSDRYGVSEAATAELFNEQNRRRDGDQSQPVSRWIVHRLKKKMRLEELQQFRGSCPEALGVDERKDKTKVEVGKGAKGGRRFEQKTEEHAAVILYPGGFAGHVTPEEGSAPELARSVLSMLERRGIHLHLLRALLTDGCSKMVGWRTGFHASMEKILGWSLQRIICFFHHLEKSFEKILVLYAGHTTSPRDLALPVGKSIQGEVHKLDLVTFTVMPNPQLLKIITSIPSDSFQEFNSDHRIFIQLVKSVITGKTDGRWCSMRIGPLVHSRFTTTQTRCLRVYISDPDPSFGLTRIIHYLIYVWAEVFLTSRHQHSLSLGPRLLLLETILVRTHLTYPERTVVYKSLCTNGQFAHPEAVLLSLLSSPLPEERARGVRTILAIRSRGTVVWDTPTGQRPFKVR